MQKQTFYCGFVKSQYMLNFKSNANKHLMVYTSQNIAKIMARYISILIHTKTETTKSYLRLIPNN